MTLSDYINGADEEARILWANTCSTVAEDIRAVLSESS